MIGAGDGLCRRRPETSARPAQELQERLRRGVRDFLGDEVTSGQCSPADCGCALRAPELEWVEQCLDNAAFAPQNEQITRDLLAADPRDPIMLEVDPGRGAVVLAGGVD